MAGADQSQNSFHRHHSDAVERSSQMQEEIVPSPQVTVAKGCSSGSESKVRSASSSFPPEKPNLTLSLSLSGEGHTHRLARSISLVSNLVLNEQAPPPPRDFLSLSRSCSLPAGTGAGVQLRQQHNQYELQMVAYLEYQRKRNIADAESQWRLLMEQKMARDRAIMHQQVMMSAPPALQQRNQAVVAPSLMLPQQQAMLVPPAQRHHLHRQVLALPSLPLPQQQQEFLLPLKSSSMNNLVAAVASAGTPPALYQALNISATGGSINPASAQMDLAHIMAANRGKHRLVTRSENAPLFISSSGSSRMATAVEVLGSETLAKRMRLMRDKAFEDGLELMRQMPGVAFKDGESGGDKKDERAEGFLYRYCEGEVSILCSCHGTLLTPAEFVERAGGADMDNLMKHIIVSSNMVPPS